MSSSHEILRLERVGSTMDVVDQRARTGAPERLVVVADEQTAGRGRGGHVWIAPPGSSLLFSILLRPPVEPMRLGTMPLLIGVAVAEAIESLSGLSCELKWPNDVWIGGRKVAGILVQSRLKPGGVDFVNAGIGINVTTRADELVPGATSIAVETGRIFDRDLLLNLLLDRIDRGYAEFVATGGHPSLDGWRRRAALLNRHVIVKAEHQDVSGTFVGVDDDGYLRLEQDDGAILSIVSGELIRGPREIETGSE